MLSVLSRRHPADCADPPGAAAESVFPVPIFSPGRGTGGLWEPGQATVPDQVRDMRQCVQRRNYFFQQLLHISLRLYPRLQLLCETKPSEVRQLGCDGHYDNVWPQWCRACGHWRGGGPGGSPGHRHSRPGKLHQRHVQRLPGGLLRYGFVMRIRVNSRLIHSNDLLTFDIGLGGAGDWRTVTTLPNLLRQFNPNLIGFSAGNNFKMDWTNGHSPFYFK